jgi:hypothetical protein
MLLTATNLLFWLNCGFHWDLLVSSVSVKTAWNCENIVTALRLTLTSSLALWLFQDAYFSYSVQSENLILLEAISFNHLAVQLMHTHKTHTYDRKFSSRKVSAFSLCTSDSLEHEFNAFLLPCHVGTATSIFPFDYNPSRICFKCDLHDIYEPLLGYFT